MEEALHDTPLYREFALLDAGNTRLPDESTILRFRHLLEEHQLAPQILSTVNDLLTKQGLLLKSGTAVDATLIAAPSSTKNSTGKRDPQMHQTKKGGSWYFGMKAHIGVDADSGLVHTVATTPANAHDITKSTLNNSLFRTPCDVHADVVSELPIYFWVAMIKIGGKKAVASSGSIADYVQLHIALHEAHHQSRL